MKDSIGGCNQRIFQDESSKSVNGELTARSNGQVIRPCLLGLRLAAYQKRTFMIPFVVVSTRRQGTLGDRQGAFRTLF